MQARSITIFLPGRGVSCRWVLRLLSAALGLLAALTVWWLISFGRAAIFRAIPLLPSAGSRFGSQSMQSTDSLGEKTSQEHYPILSFTGNIATTIGVNRIVSPSQPICQYPSPSLVGVVLPNKYKSLATQITVVEEYLSYLLPGGCWKPSNCKAHDGSVAVIIPCHNRQQNLMTLLYYLVPMLKRQQQDFCIYIGSQSRASNGTRFNKGAIINALFVEAMAERNWSCVCVHDVDLVPENDFNSYSCPHTHVKNVIGSIDRYGYRLPYPQVFGGATISMSHHFRHYNGLITTFWGWGSEDDDHRRRVVWAGLKWQRSDNVVGRYTHLDHGASPTNPDRFGLIPHAERLWKQFGLNTLKYSIQSKERARLYTSYVITLPSQGSTGV